MMDKFFDIRLFIFSLVGALIISVAAVRIVSDFYYKLIVAFIVVGALLTGGYIASEYENCKR